MARNPVAANILLAFLLIGGMLTSFSIRQEVFPPLDLDILMVTVPYPGTSPEEIEKGVILALEEAARGINGVKRVTSTASESVGMVTVELLRGTDGNKALQDLKNAVDRITTFPEDSERPTVSLLEASMEVITVVLYGDQEEHVLERLGEEVRDDLLNKPDITSVALEGVRPLEISIEIPQAKLREHKLTLAAIARKVRSVSVEYSAGGVKADGGEILLRVKERRDYGRDFSDIPIVSRADGTVVRLADIATIIDGYEDTDEAAYYNGQPAVMLKIYREEDQTPTGISADVKSYIAELSERLPEGVSVSTFDDTAEHYRDRIDLLLRNGSIGLVLVMICLGMFINVRLAFWVMMGIPASFLGTLLLLPAFDVSINMISLFAFIMALGIVVDDAIVVGENVYTKRTQGMSRIEAAIDGTKEVVVPVTFSIVTNIVAFVPLMFVAGIMGKIMRIIPIVVCLAFAISLFEAAFILPAHLAHSGKGADKGIFGILARGQARIARGLEWAIGHLYRPLLMKALAYRYVTLSISVAVLIIVLGFVASGRIAFVFSPSAEGDGAIASVTLPFGTPVEDTAKVQDRLVRAAQKVIHENGGDDVTMGIFSHIGASQGGFDPHAALESGGAGHQAYVRVFLVGADERNFTAKQFANMWRDETGEIPGVETLLFKSDDLGPGAGDPAIDIELSHKDIDTLETAATGLADALREYPAVRDIDDGFALGKPQLDFQIRPEAYSLGLTPAEIGSQVRSTYYGAEALRMQRGRNEVKVMVRCPESERISELSLEELLVRTPAGGELPLAEAASVVRGRSYTEINRTNGRRTIHVMAEDVVPISEKNLILNSLEETTLVTLENRYRGLAHEMGGEDRERMEAMESLRSGFILALIAIFGILGIVFRSYIQPVIIMIAIPFGIVGAVVGHIIMGFNLSLISMMGIVALAGVVVNDALVLISFANRIKADGMSDFEAISEAGVRRFRPIMLTTLTTFFGLLPMIFETSPQARFLIPMAISLGYGLLFATLIVLLLVPSLYLIVEDVRGLFGLRKRFATSSDFDEEAKSPA
jgi:multidrug efflux pump subunit AcrB